MFIRAYLRASTDQQDASRAKQALIDFAATNGHKIASFYVENESGATLQRPELFRLLEDAHTGDVLLVEQVDRLARLTESDWQKLRGLIAEKGLTVVALDLPTSHTALTASALTDAFTGRMLAAINSMLLDMLAAVARKDYEDRRRRQGEGIAKAKNAGAYQGRQVDAELHSRIKRCLDSGMSIRKCAEVVGCAVSTVQRAKATLTS